MSATIVTALVEAAERAEAAPTLRKAISAAWARVNQIHLDTDSETMGEAFRIWCASEGFSRHPSGLGEVLRRRYHSPSDVGLSLRRAATEVRS